MLIRHKLILKFSILVGALFIGFSIAIYIFYAFGKENLFRSRLENKAISTGLIFSKKNKLDEIAMLSLSDQYEVIYDEHNHKLYSIGSSRGFIPSIALLQSIKLNKQLYFSYGREIEGVGIYYTYQNKRIIVIVTAIDSFGIEHMRSLKNILIIGNIIGLSLTFFAALFFSKQALKPINNFIYQIRQLSGNNLYERLPEGNVKDEMTNLAIEFNKLLDKVETIVESHKSFVSNTSHEFRTPLATILGILETSYEYDTNIEIIKKSVHSAMEELKKIIELTNGLLNLIQVGNKETTLKYDQIDLLEVVLESIRVNRNKFVNQHIEFNVNKIEIESIGYFVKGNKHLLTIALSNIIDNACKYSNNSNVSVVLSLDLGNKVELLIKDEGYGISENDQRKIFDPLYRGENIKSISGYGIGLALVYKIIRLHHASIIINSKINKGTTVKVLFDLF